MNMAVLGSRQKSEFHVSRSNGMSSFYEPNCLASRRGRGSNYIQFSNSVYGEMYIHVQKKPSSFLLRIRSKASSQGGWIHLSATNMKCLFSAFTPKGTRFGLGNPATFLPFNFELKRKVPDYYGRKCWSYSPFCHATQMPVFPFKYSSFRPFSRPFRSLWIWKPEVSRRAKRPLYVRKGRPP